MPKLPTATLTVKTLLPNSEPLYAEVGIAHRTQKGGYWLNVFRRHKALRPLAEMNLIVTARKSPHGAATHNVQAVTENGAWDFVGTGFGNDDGSIGLALDKQRFPELSDLRFYLRPARATRKASADADGPLGADELTAATTSEATRAMSGVHTF